MPAMLLHTTVYVYAEVQCMPAWLQGRAIVFLMKRVDPEFDEADFLEGAKDAYHIGAPSLSPQACAHPAMTVCHASRPFC